jgi:hypothetical protein
MEIVLNRFAYNDNSTIGTLHIDSKFFGFTLEDKKRPLKIAKVTCIPSGRYEILLRKEGRIHASYGPKFNFHKGMLHLQDVPNYKWIYIHIGNSAKDTDGCILVGLQYIQGQEQITHSQSAYKLIYEKILSGLLRGEKVFISVNDLFF